MKQGIDVSEQVKKVYELYGDNKINDDKYIELLDKMKTTEFWLNYSEEVKKFIEENDKVFFCEWDGYIGEIHSVESMYDQYKDSNLFPNTLLGYMTESRNGGSLDDIYSKDTFGNYDDFVSVVKYSYVGEVVVEDNMTIVRLK